MDEIRLLNRLKRPDGKVRMVLDTDTYNEIDDQYALAYALLSGDRLQLEAIYAAPFSNSKAKTPGEGMEKSYDEIHRVLKLMKREELASVVYRGSESYLPDENTPVDSPAARDLISRAMAQPSDEPLYVVAIGAITNVASALLLEPKIAEKIVLVWLGGHELEWPDTREFNMVQDIPAARVAFGCGVPLVQLPCMGVVSAFTTTGPELTHWLKGKNILCDYLCDITHEEAVLCKQGNAWSRALWDVTAVAWLTGDFMLDRLEHSPIPTMDGHYAFDRRRHLIRYVYHIRRDKLMEDLFTKLAKA